MRTFVFLICCIFLGSSLSFGSILSSEIPITSFNISQESFHKNGVLVARPRPLDQQIQFFIETNQIQSLESLSQWLKANIIYQNDIDGDRWASPEETFESKTGDCEDFAFLVQSVLKVLGYQPVVVALCQSTRAHAICFFQVDGFYCWFDNAVFKKTLAQSLEAFLRTMTTEHNLTAIVELDFEKKRETHTLWSDVALRQAF
jgi:predicted transglutaminase-like cysteine proteinase